MTILRNASLAVFFSVAMPFVSAEGEREHSKASPIESAFATTIAKIKVTPGDQVLPVTWTYTNHWDFPLAVERFEESCGCLSGQMAKVNDSPQSVAPGESGTIRATFTPGANRGVIRKSLHVRFVGHDKAVELVAEAIIPSPVQLSSQQLDWNSAEKPEKKTVDVTTGTDADFSITGLLGLPENQFSLTTETIVPRRHYRLQITPTATATGQHILQVRTDSADPRDQVLPIFILVSPASAELAPPTP